MNLDSYRAKLDRGAPIWFEVLWQIARVPFFLLPVPLPSGLRVAVLRCFGATLGRGVVIRQGVDITFPWRLQCGDHVWFGENCKILNLAPIRIGSNVCLSQQAFLCTGSHDYRSKSFDLITKPIDVGCSCWIGARSFIMPGISLGNRAIVAACSVVTHNVPEDYFAAGNPATLRKRKSDWL